MVPAVLLAGVLALVGSGFGVYSGVTAHVAEIWDEPRAGTGGLGDSPATEATEEPLDVLLLGMDRRPGGEVEGEGSRTDAMMLARVFPETGEIKVVSIPRDLLVEVETGVYDRVNTAFTRGGVSKAKEAVEDLTGIAADRHVVADFHGFEAVVDALGGVEVDVEEELPPGWRIETGPQKLDGRQALLYARYRDTERGDLDRIERQQRLVDALREQALQMASLTRLPGVIGALGTHVETDVGPLEAGSIGRSLASGGEGPGMETVKLTGTPHTRPNGDQVLLPSWQANRFLLAEDEHSGEETGEPTPERAAEAPSPPAVPATPGASSSAAQEGASPATLGATHDGGGAESREVSGGRGGYGSDQYGWSGER